MRSPGGNLLEAGLEMMLVTNKSADAVPLFTVARAYSGTSATGGHTTNTPLLIDPLWARADLNRWIETFYRTTMNAYLPYITSQVMQREPANQYVTMPADTVRVLSLRHISSITGRVIDLGTWRFEEDLPSSVVSTGKLLRLSAGIYDADELIVTYQAPYAFSDTTETGTIDVPLGSEDLAPLWACAYGLSRREVSRSELDKIEEWNQDQAYRQGVNLRLVQQTWGEFYRRIDEARKIQYVPRSRPYRKMAKPL